MRFRKGGDRFQAVARRRGPTPTPPPTPHNAQRSKRAPHATVSVTPDANRMHVASIASTIVALAVWQLARAVCGRLLSRPPDDIPVPPYGRWRIRMARDTSSMVACPVDPYLSPILTHRGERTIVRSILMWKRPGCRPTEVRARMPPPADGSGPATVRGPSEPRLGMHRGDAKASVPPRSPGGDLGGEGVKIAHRGGLVFPGGSGDPGEAHPDPLS